MYDLIVRVVVKGSAQTIPARNAGRYITRKYAGESVRAYVPVELPPKPPVRLGGVQVLLDEANRAVGRLDGFARFLPDISLFIYAWVRKEAVLSSQIEGTQSSLSDLLQFECEEVPGAPVGDEAPGASPNRSAGDVQEVSRYVAAMQHGLERMAGGFPLSLRLLREMHGILLAGGRGRMQNPGEFRTTQNWIGGTRPGNAGFVPPPPELVPECMGALEQFICGGSRRMPVLVKAALAHVQFETIHPFLDGNGRLGRQLITLLLCVDKAIRDPILYLSLYLKTHRSTYYELLERVRATGEWEVWLEFFLTGVRDTADQAAAATLEIVTLLEADYKRIEGLGRPSASALEVFRYLQRHPITSIRAMTAQTGMTTPTATKSLEHLAKLGVVREVTGRRRGRMFSYGRYLAMLNAGTEVR